MYVSIYIYLNRSGQSKKKSPIVFPEIEGLPFQKATKYKKYCLTLLLQVFQVTHEEPPGGGYSTLTLNLRFD